MVVATHSGARVVVIGPHIGPSKVDNSLSTDASGLHNRRNGVGNATEAEKHGEVGK